MIFCGKDWFNLFFGGRDYLSLAEQQMQKLHDLAALNREQAEVVLLERLERELTETVAARIQKHEEQLRQNAETKATPGTNIRTAVADAPFDPAPTSNMTRKLTTNHAAEPQTIRNQSEEART